MSEKKPIPLRISNVAPFGLRMLPELRTKIEEASLKSGNSLNAEIINRLENSFQANFEQSDIDEIADMVLGRISQHPRSVPSKARKAFYDHYEEAKLEEGRVKRKFREAATQFLENLDDDQ